MLTLSAARLSPRRRVADWFGHDLEVTRSGPDTRIRLDLTEYDHAVLEWDA